MPETGPQELIIGFVTALGLVWPGTWLFRRLTPRLGLIDIPNPRSSHAVPIPRAGGVVFVVVVPLVALVIALRTGIVLAEGEWALLITGWFVAGVSLIDDWRPLPARLRLVAQSWAAVGLIVYGGYLHYFGAGSFGVIDVGRVGVLITFVWIISLANAFNFMDGMDGLAAGQGLIASVAIAWLSMSIGLGWISVLSAALAGGMLGFLIHNAPPARVFMGDVGSIWLGFTFAGLAVLGADRGEERMSLGFWVLLLGVFLLDTGLTLARRLLQGEPVLQAHRTHYYQRLLGAGWGHRRVTALYLLMAAGLASVSVVHFDIVRLPFAVFVAVGLLTFAGTFTLVNYVESHKSQLEEARGVSSDPVAVFGLGPPVARFLRASGKTVLLDAFIITLMYTLSFLGRFAWQMNTAYPFYLGLRDGIIAIVFVHLTLNAAFGLYSRRGDQVGINMFLRAVAATTCGGLALMVGEVLLGPVRAIPLSVLGMGAVLSCAGFLTLRRGSNLGR